jgi:REP-associated tyrosine transposase
MQHKVPMSRLPRLADSEYAGVRRYFLTVCTWQRERIFTNNAAVDLVWEQFRYTADAEFFDIVAYCFMPDHAHFLLEGRNDSADFKRFVRLAKQRAGWRYRQRVGNPLWQDSYHDRILRSAENTATIAAYVLGNPIRAGLVERVEDYPFWGSSLYRREELIEYVSSRA